MLARAWGCTPAQLRDCTVAELDAMTDLLIRQRDEAQAAAQAAADERMEVA